MITRTGFHFRVVGRPEFRFDITKAQLDILLRCSSVHYDMTCSDASRVGGFLYGWNNLMACAAELTPPKTIAQVTATLRELDTLCKILEMPPPDVDKREAAGMIMSFYDVLRFASGWREQWVVVYDATREVRTHPQ